MAYFSVIIIMVLVAMTVGASDEDLLRKISKAFPDFLSLDIETIENFLLMKGSKSDGEYYVPLPEGGRQKGRCDEVLTSRGEGEDLRWLQGHTNLTNGAATVVVHLSSVGPNLDILRKLNKIYHTYRELGLNLLGIFSHPTGYALSLEDEEDVATSLKHARIAFPCVALGSKRGIPPTLRGGFIDTPKAQAVPTSPRSLFRWLHGDLAFMSPLSIVMKNCLQMQKEPLHGWGIMGLEGSLQVSAKALLWPEEEHKDSPEQVEQFRGMLLEFELSEEEVGGPLDQEEDEEETRSKSTRRKRRRTRTEPEEDEENEEEEEKEEREEEEARPRGRRRRRGGNSDL